MMKNDLTKFEWQPEPTAAAVVTNLLAQFITSNSELASLAKSLLSKTGTRLIDWVDHIALVADHAIESELLEVGFKVSLKLCHTEKTGNSVLVWKHPKGMFPPILTGVIIERLGIKVEHVEDYLAANRLSDKVSIDGVTTEKITIEGIAGGPFRQAEVSTCPERPNIWIVERRGFEGFFPPEISPQKIKAAATALHTFRHRERSFKTSDEGFNATQALIRTAQKTLEPGWVCALFFQAEREYWQSKNKAAHVQFTRQNSLGLGWANHDHHTYRSSRHCFTKLIETLEVLGFFCRERFYAGSEAGWGAQVLEHSETGILIFADVDLSVEEVAGDFGHEQLLEERKEIGTIGLWCFLHGEAFLQAGLHHLECLFDFEASRSQLTGEGIASMDPFTNFDFLKQCFTQGEVWPVSKSRLQEAQERGWITADQVEEFSNTGVLGSHLELLERNEGYKGFNQTGISDIIARTDPRNRELG